MLPALEILNQILNVRIVQYALLIGFVVLCIYTPIRVGYLKYDNALLKSTVSDISGALYIQNEKVRELGAKTEELKTNYEQANKRATQVALEGQRTLQELMKQQFVGSCEDKVRQANELVKKGLQK